MDKNGKVWGCTGKIFAKNNVEVHRIEGSRNGRSSMHKHAMKWSMFFVEHGKIAVDVEKRDYHLTDRTILSSGESIILKPGEFHRFEILQHKTVCYEIYWVELDPNDIIRRDVGSRGRRRIR